MAKRVCHVLAQGIHRLRDLLQITLVFASPHAAAACPPPAIAIEPIAEGVWWVPAAGRETDRTNRGQISNLLLVRDGRWLWALGSGPSPAFGRALACQARERLGQAITDTISPWPRPELVLGAGGIAPARHWAHARVAAAMAQQCPRCVDRLRLQLGDAAIDLGRRPIALPRQLVRGESGRLGPWRWWLVARGAGHWTTVWRLDRSALWSAPGLLWGDAPADARDADITQLATSTAMLAELAQADGAAARWIGEQGAPADAHAPARQRDYWLGLIDTVRSAIERGDAETAPPLAWPGLPAHWAADPQHALNWQRAWRQLEAQVFDQAR